MKKNLYLFIFWIFAIFAQNPMPKYLQASTPWADSMSMHAPIKDLIGQIFMVAVYPKKNDTNFNLSLIKKYKIGGLMFMQTNADLLVEHHNLYQAASEIPLLTSMDAEWGLAMRTENVFAYPKAMALGAISDAFVIEKMAENMAKQFIRTGIHINFAPVADINNNPKNPVINYRSFGEDPYQVIEKTLAYHRGLSNRNILSCAKHFPGHGNVEIDSHTSLPILTESKEELKTKEWLPFKALIDEDLGCVMIGHLQVPAIDSLPASLSSKHIEILKNELNYQGLIFTDALNMGAVKNKYPEKGRLGVEALLAGNDILVFPEDLPETYQKILEALENGTLNEQDFRLKIKKILQLKEWLKLWDKTEIDKVNLTEDLKKNEAIIRKTTEKTLTLLKNEDRILPLMPSANEKITVVLWGNEGAKNFENTLLKFHSGFEFLNLVKEPSKDAMLNIVQQVKNNATVVISLHHLSNQPAKNYQFNANLFDEFLQELHKKTKKIILNFLGNPYSLNQIQQIDLIKALLLGYENNIFTQNLTAQLVMGALGPEGKLPINLDAFLLGTGKKYKKIRLAYGIAEEVGMETDILQKMDSVVQIGLEAKAFPGCKVLVVKDGKIIFDRNYGFYTYNKDKAVNDSTIYDLASITKIVSSTLAIMKLESEEQLQTEADLETYLPQLLGTAYGKIQIEDILAHQAGLTPWIPFYMQTIPSPPFSLKNVKKNKLNELISKDYYSPYPEKDNTVQVAESLYLRKEYIDSIFNAIINTPVKTPKEQYVYSDLGFYFIPWLVEKLTEKDFQKYIEDIYHQLGLQKIGYLPLNWTNKKNIPPTGIDKYFRHQTIQGYVNDEGAAMLGGVSGHAGVFSSAYDLAAIMQLFLNKGTYYGVQVFDPGLMEKYTKNISENNHRGLGFDKLKAGREHVASNKASWESFGHSGFTGTFAWADPAYDLIFIFLSNRTYPSSENRLLSKLGIRTHLHNLVYEALQL